MAKVAIIAALQREIAALVRGPGWCRSRVVPGYPGYENDQALVVCAGMGWGPALKAAECVMAAASPSVLVSAGLAGALTSDWKTGQVMIPETVVVALASRPAPGSPSCAGFARDGVEVLGASTPAVLRITLPCAPGADGTSVPTAGLPPQQTKSGFAGDPGLEASATFSASSGTRIGGVLLSAPDVARRDAKPFLARQHGAHAIDMEAAPVAQVAAEHGIPFVAVKAISDEFDFPMPELGPYIGPQGKFRTLRFVLHTTLRPRMWPVVSHLASDSSRASLRLCQELRLLLESGALDAIAGRMTSCGANVRLGERSQR